VRRPVDAADPARHVLLGLLLGGPSHGYILAQAFAPGTVLGSVVHLGSSHLYALLSQLERDNLISGARHEQGTRPTRRVYELTEAGRDTVERWIDEPVARPRDVLLDFPLKLYLAQRLDIGRALALIACQRALFVTYLDDLKHATDHSSTAADRPFVALVHDGRVERTRSTIAWLDRCATLLAHEATTS
jgi:DNA-binding PadR family transcriptional regulator